MIYNQINNCGGDGWTSRHMTKARGGALMKNIISGVYVVTNSVNGHCYIGSSADVGFRWGKHQRDLQKGKHHSIYLQRAWNKYGESAFTFSILEYCEESLLIEREQYYLDKFKPEYNIVRTAGKTTGYKHTEKTIKKIVSALTGRPVSAETRRKIGNANKGKLIGRTLPEDHRQKIIAGLIGRVRTEESKNKNSKALKAWYQTPAGLKKRKTVRPLSKEALEKIGNAHRGKSLSYETRKKISAALSGRTGNESNAAKPVCQYSKAGLFVARYSCAAEAERATGISRSHIGNCCKGKRKSTGGFIWKYAERGE